MIYEDLEDKALSLLITDETTSENNVYILNGIVTHHENEFVLVCATEGKTFPLLREWQEKLQSVKSEVRDIFNADYFISLSVGSRPKDVQPGEFIPTGWKLPT